MSHQPFETWIFDLDKLPMEDRRALQTHLEGCQQCQRMQRKWQSAQRELRARRLIAPAPGFIQRWQFGLVERKAREQRRQAWRVFLALMGSALLILLLLAGYVMATSTPSDWLASVIRYTSTSLDLYNLVSYLIQTWLTRTPLALNIALWIYVAVTICLLSLAWVFALWRTSTIGARTK